jgi:hypothetical protein
MSSVPVSTIVRHELRDLARAAKSSTVQQHILRREIANVKRRACMGEPTHIVSLWRD